MSSIRCPHCGLASFSSTGTCKRCKKALSAAAEPASTYLPTADTKESSFRFRTDYPLVSWVITFLLLIANASLAYVVSRKTTTIPYRALGGMIGGILAWPLVLLIVYLISRKFREKYSLHAVINYGLALNTLIQSTMTQR